MIGIPIKKMEGKSDQMPDSSRGNSRHNQALRAHNYGRNISSSAHHHRHHFHQNHSDRRRGREVGEEMAGEDEEERARRRLMEARRLRREAGKSPEGQGGKRGTRSDRILDSLMEDVRRSQKVKELADLVLTTQEVHLNDTDERKSQKSKKKHKNENEKHHKSKRKKRDKDPKDEEKESRRQRKDEKKHGKRKHRKSESDDERRMESDKGENGEQQTTKEAEEDALPAGADFQLFKPATDEEVKDQTNKDNSETSNDEEEEEDDAKSKEGEGFPLKKEKPSLATILSSAPPKFPWLFPQKNKKEESSEPKEGVSAKSAPVIIDKAQSETDKKPVAGTQEGVTFSAGFSMPNWLFRPRNQQINIRLKKAEPEKKSEGERVEEGREAETEEKEGKEKEEKKEEEKEVSIEVEKEEEKEGEQREQNDADEEKKKKSLLHKALSGGTLWQRAATTVTVKQEDNDKAGGGDTTRVPLSADGAIAAGPSNPMLSAALSCGVAQLGIVTPATRAAATSDWRRKSERELKQKCKSNFRLRKMMRSPRQDGELSSAEDGEKMDGEFDVDDPDVIDMDISGNESEDDGEEEEEKERDEHESSDGEDGRKKTDSDDQSVAGSKKNDENKKKEKQKRKKRKKQKEREEEEEDSDHRRKRKKSKKNKRKRDSSESRKQKRAHHRSSSGSRTRSTGRRHARRSSSTRSRSSSVRRQQLRHRSRSRTYSTSPERQRHSRERSDRRHHHRSPSPLPPFSRQRAFETRRKLIEESWHRRIEHSVRPCDDPDRHRRSSGGGGFSKADYTDENGEIDKQKLLEIATRNATKLAMEGKLPKGAELVDTIKNKSVEQLVDLCKQLQSDRKLVLPRHGGDSSSNSDEESRYSRKYDRWREERERREDREFRNRAVRESDRPAKVSRRERLEVVRREENTLRLTYPVSSGVQHRTKANQPIPELPAGPLVRYGDIGPLTTALARVRTNIPAAYKPLSKPLPTAQPSSALSSCFQSTSQVQIGPQIPADQLPKPSVYPDFVPAKTPDCVNATAYEIALAATARKQEAEQDKMTAKEPILATSADFIGPTLPNPAAKIVMAASVILGSETPAPNSVPTPPSSSSSTFHAPSSSSSAPSTAKPVFSSSWDRPGHIAAREALLRKVLEQKRMAEEAEKVAVEKAQPTPAATPFSATEKTHSIPIAQPTPATTPSSATENTQPISATPSFEPEKSQTTPTAQPTSATPSSTISEQPSSFSLISTSEADGSASQLPERAETTAEAPKTTTTDDGLFKKPVLPSSATATKQSFVPSAAGTPMLLPTTKNPVNTPAKAKEPSGNKTGKAEEKNKKEEEKEKDNTEKMDFLDRFNDFAEAQIARQKAESVLHATILNAHLEKQKQPEFPAEPSTFASQSSSRRAPPPPAAPYAPPVFRTDPIGLTKPQKSIQELVAERMRYNQRLLRDPNDYEARRILVRIEEEMTSWAQNTTLPGEFTGHTGARVLSEKELGPSDPRFHAWAKKDQFRLAPEINSGIGLQLLQRMGWQPGQGLGRDRAGQIEPLALDVKADRKGLFSCFEKAPTRESVLDPHGKNPISVLMEQCAKRGWRNPEFYCCESGPHNNRKYHWKAVLNGVEYAPSLPSSNKRAGKAQVCMVILEALGLTNNV